MKKAKTSARRLAQAVTQRMKRLSAGRNPTDVFDRPSEVSLRDHRGSQRLWIKFCGMRDFPG